MGRNRPQIWGGTTAEVTCPRCVDFAARALNNGLTADLAPRLSDSNPPTDPALMALESPGYRQYLTHQPRLHPDVTRALLAASRRSRIELDHIARMDGLPDDVVRQLWTSTVERTNQGHLGLRTQETLHILQQQYGHIVTTLPTSPAGSGTARAPAGSARPAGSTPPSAAPTMATSTSGLSLLNRPWRVGRKVGRTLYAQLGDQPSDSDPLIGLMDTATLAREAATAHNIKLRTAPR